MARSPIERCRAAGNAAAQTGPGPAIAVRVHVRARRAFTTAGWRKMVARLGAAARLGFQGPPAHVAARLVAFSLPTRTPTGAPCRRISASHPRASGLMHSDGPEIKNCGTGSMRTRSSESGGRTLIKIQPMWHPSTGKNMSIIEVERCGECAPGHEFRR